jgi:hypothetical protein
MHTFLHLSGWFASSATVVAFANNDRLAASFFVVATLIAAALLEWGAA